MPRRVSKRARFCRRSWPDLPHDLLGEVIQRLPAFGDRRRLRAVCRQWRDAERAHAQPAPMPWLVAAGHFVSVHDAAIHRVVLPEDAGAATACRGSFGNWLALVPVSPPPCQPFLLNPFTMARILLPVWTGGTIKKIMLSLAPDSEDCTVAAVVGCEFSTQLRLGSVAVCRLRQRETSRPWWCITETFYLEDIIFFQGKLHAVDGLEQTYAFEDDELEQMRDLPLFHRRDRVAPFSAHKKYYLVACHGRLLMVCRSFGTNRVPGGGYHTVGFKVSAVTKHSYGRTTPPPPVPVKSFDGHALFVGDACCGAFAVTDEGSKIREDQICYADDETNTRVGGGAFTAEGADCGHRPPSLRLLQSYDTRTDCFRRYQPRRRPAGPWECVMAQRLLRREALPPPPATEWGATLLLWEVMSTLGANVTPCYCRPRRERDPDIHAVDLIVNVYHQGWSFTMTGGSVQEAKQKAAREAVTFLRSRYRRVLDDSQWSYLPYSRSHVDEEEYEDLEGYETN